MRHLWRRDDLYLFQMQECHVLFKTTFKEGMGDTQKDVQAAFQYCRLVQSHE